MAYVDTDGAFALTNEMTMKHSLFQGALVVAEYLQRCIDMDKKTRIVIDYDPQEVNTYVRCYEAKDAWQQDQRGKTLETENDDATLHVHSTAFAAQKESSKRVQHLEQTRIIDAIRLAVKESNATASEAISALKRVVYEVETLAMSSPMKQFKDLYVDCHGSVCKTVCGWRINEV